MKSNETFLCFIKQVIAAEGEQKASRALREASEVIADSSSALQLRYLQVCFSQWYEKLIDHVYSIIYIDVNFSDSYSKRCIFYYLFIFQTLNNISAEKNSTIIFPLPIDLITHFMKEKKA